MWGSSTSTPSPSAGKSDADEVKELKAMIGTSPTKNAKKNITSGSTETDSLKTRPAWDSRPLVNPPGNVRGLRPMTNEPWRETAEADNNLRMQFGSRDALGYQDIEEAEWARNGFVREAKARREQNDRQNAWDSSIVRHAPPVLRGQKARRREPWSAYNNDSIEELNAVDGTSINDIYNITADRDTRTNHAMTNPEWDNSQKLGRRSHRPDQHTAARAKVFRDQRKAGTRAGSPPQAYLR